MFCQKKFFFSREISVKVYLYDRFAVEFVHDISVRSIMY